MALPPGYDALRSPLRTTLGFYIFEEGEWSSYNSSNRSETEFFPAITDLVDVTYNRQNQKYYFASFGEGIIEWGLGDELRILDESTSGSTLENIIPGGRNVLISSIYSDGPGMVWATNFGNPSSIHRFNPNDDTWTAYTASFQAGKFPLDLQIAENNDLWLRLDPNNGGGIMVFNPESTLQKHLTDLDGTGGLPSREVKDLVIDKNGQVWVGTDKGVSHYPFPFDILVNPVVNASPVLIDGRPLLRDEPVNCISVDGGNQKWIGTDNGIWLFTIQGDSVLYHFTTENSPLPSNKILDVEVNNTSGEVFIVTDLGTVSFRGISTEGLPEHTQVRIFPNPVTGDFNGLVGISGLVNNAIVKVADVTGKLVNEFKAAGGTAVWDIRDFQGRRVQSGVYLVFSSSPDGNETFIGKIAVIN
jgi:streptogramin lyase